MSTLQRRHAIWGHVLYQKRRRTLLSITLRAYAQKSKTFKPAFADGGLDGSKASPFSGLELPQPSSFQPSPPGGRMIRPYHNINNYEKAAACVAGLDPSFYKNTTIIEINPGPGIFTRALFNQINPKNYVLFDRSLAYKDCLTPLVEASDGVIKHYDLDGWAFESYSEVLKRNLITPEIQDRSQINSSLLLVGNLTESEPRRSEGFVAQLISFMYSDTFLYHFGRVKTLVWMGSAWRHFVAPPGHLDRKKVSIIRELSCDSRVIASTLYTEPTRRAGASLPKRTHLKLNYSKEIINLQETDIYPENACALLDLTPYQHKKSNVPLDELEYLVLKLNIISGQPIDKAMTIVAPGADVLLKSIGPYSPNTTPNALTTEQWIKLADAFHRWHFKPDVLEDEAYASEKPSEEFRDSTILPSLNTPFSSDFELDDEMDEMDEMDEPNDELSKAEAGRA